MAWLAAGQCLLEVNDGGVGNVIDFGKSEADFTAGACNAGAACCIGTAGAGKLGGLSKLTWHDAEAPIVPIAGGSWKTGGPVDVFKSPLPNLPIPSLQ